MKPFKPDKGIETEEDFNDYASEILERFCESLRENFTRPIEEDDIMADDWTFVYCNGGSELVRRMHRRLAQVGEVHFHDYSEAISTHLFQEQ